MKTGLISIHQQQGAATLLMVLILLGTLAMTFGVLYLLLENDRILALRQRQSTTQYHMANSALAWMRHWLNHTKWQLGTPYPQPLNVNKTTETSSISVQIETIKAKPDSNQADMATMPSSSSKQAQHICVHVIAHSQQEPSYRAKVSQCFQEKADGWRVLENSWRNWH